MESECDKETKRRIGLAKAVFHSMSNMYTLNHKKRDILVLTITLANLTRFLTIFYIIVIVKKFYMQL